MRRHATLELAISLTLSVVVGLDRKKSSKSSSSSSSFCGWVVIINSSFSVVV